MKRPIRTPIERRRRAAARLSLYGSLTLVAGLIALTAPVAERWYDTNIRSTWAHERWEEMRAVQLLRDYVRINTSHDTGDEIAGAAFLAQVLRASGIEPTIEIMGPRNANLWAVIEGDDPRALILHNHIDTDPLNDGPHWKHPPLSGQIDRPWIFGRGVFDMKSVTIAQLMAFLEIQESGKRPARSLIFLATGSEEVGSELGSKWILRNRPEIASRAWAVLTEGGGVEALTTEAVKYWGIEAAQRGYVELWFCADDPAPLELVREEIASGLFGRDDYQLTAEVAAVWKGYAATRSIAPLQSALDDPAALLRDLGRLETLPRYLRSMLRDEIVVGKVYPAGGGGFELRTILQLLPGSKRAEALAKLAPPHLGFGLARAMVGPEDVPRGSDPAHPLFQIMVERIQARHPDIVVGPYFIPFSATDSRYFRPAGIPSFGFSPFLIMSTDTLQVGRPNERMALPAYVAGVELYRDVVFAATL